MRDVLCVGYTPHAWYPCYLYIVHAKWFVVFRSHLWGDSSLRRPHHRSSLHWARYWVIFPRPSRRLPLQWVCPSHVPADVYHFSEYVPHTSMQTSTISVSMSLTRPCGRQPLQKVCSSHVPPNVYHFSEYIPHMFLQTSTTSVSISLTRPCRRLPLQWVCPSRVSTNACEWRNVIIVILKETKDMKWNNASSSNRLLFFHRITILY